MNAKKKTSFIVIGAVLGVAAIIAIILLMKGCGKEEPAVIQETGPSVSATTTVVSSTTTVDGGEVEENSESTDIPETAPATEKAVSESVDEPTSLEDETEVQSSEVGDETAFAAETLEAVEDSSTEAVSETSVAREVGQVQTTENVVTSTAAVVSATTVETSEGHTHTYDNGKVTKKATCTEPGTKTYTCSCGNFYTETIPPMGHDFKDKVVAPTASERGYTLHSCSVCNYSYKDTFVEALGSKETSVVAHTHKYDSGKIAAAATCTASGVKVFTCSCGESYTEDISALGHNYKNEVVSPTYTENGYTKHTCTKCGYAYKDSYTDMLVKATTPAPTQPSSVAHTHSFDSGRVTRQATCTENGVKTFTCSCGHSYTEAIQKLDHDWKTETVVTKAAWDENVLVKAAWDENVLVKAAWDENVLVKAAWDENVLVKAAWSESVLVKAAWDENVLVKAAWDENVLVKAAWDENVLVKAAWDENVVVKEAWDEQVLVGAEWTEEIWEHHSFCGEPTCPIGDLTAYLQNHPEIGGLQEDGIRWTDAGIEWEDEHMRDHMLKGESSRTYSKDVFLGTIVHPAQYKTVHHDAEYKTVHHDAEYKTVHHDAEYKTVHHDAEYKTVHHDAEYKTVHHDAEYKTVHHDAEYKTVHHDAEYKTVHHDAEYKTVHHNAETKTVTRCTRCGAEK